MNCRWFSWFLAPCRGILGSGRTGFREPLPARATFRLGVTDRALQLRRVKSTTVSDASMPVTTKVGNVMKSLAVVMALALSTIATDAAA